MSAPQYFTDPDQPGAPQRGDIAVVVIDGAPGGRWAKLTGNVGCIGEVAGTFYRGDHRWTLHRVGIAHAVRWPTPAELAAYQLEGTRG